MSSDTLDRMEKGTYQISDNPITVPGTLHFKEDQFRGPIDESGQTQEERDEIYKKLLEEKKAKLLQKDKEEQREYAKKKFNKSVKEKGKIPRFIGEPMPGEPYTDVRERVKSHEMFEDKYGNVKIKGKYADRVRKSGDPGSTIVELQQDASKYDPEMSKGLSFKYETELGSLEEGTPRKVATDKGQMYFGGKRKLTKRRKIKGRRSSKRKHISKYTKKYQKKNKKRRTKKYLKK
jgi:hypothetical protein